MLPEPFDWMMDDRLLNNPEHETGLLSAFEEAKKQGLINTYAAARLEGTFSEILARLNEEGRKVKESKDELY